MTAAMLTDVPGFEPPSPPIHTELYLGAGWVIGAFIVVAALQIATVVLIALFYYDVRRKRESQPMKQSGAPGALPALLPEHRPAFSPVEEPTTQRTPPVETVSAK